MSIEKREGSLDKYIYNNDFSTSQSDIKSRSTKVTISTQKEREKKSNDQTKPKRVGIYSRQTLSALLMQNKKCVQLLAVVAVAVSEVHFVLRELGTVDRTLKFKSNY